MNQFTTLEQIAIYWIGGAILLTVIICAFIKFSKPKTVFENEGEDEDYLHIV